MRNKSIFIVAGAVLIGGGTLVSSLTTPLATVGDRSFRPRATNEAQLKSAEDPLEKELLADLLERYDRINAAYRQSVRPLFEKACFDCHFAPAALPWYSHVPGVRQLLAHDISEAKTHLDMTGEFPFAGHGSVEEDLEAIEKSIRSGEMPPGEYVLLHAAADLTPDEKEKIYFWLKNTGQILSD